jgi:hypothetical protein
MRFQQYLIEEEKYILELTYEEYCGILDNIYLNEGAIDEARPHTRDFSHELGRLYIC